MGELFNLDNVLAISGAKIRLSQARWEHIRRRHPEMERFYEEILLTVSDPDIVFEGHSQELKAARRFPNQKLAGKVVVVVYRELLGGEGFIITAHLTSRVKPTMGRKIVWRRS